MDYSVRPRMKQSDKHAVSLLHVLHLFMCDFVGPGRLTKAKCGLCYRNVSSEPTLRLHGTVRTSLAANLSHRFSETSANIFSEPTLAGHNVGIHKQTA